MNDVPQRKRRRPALACEECRRRKIKCDQQLPCDQCKRSRHGAKTCSYQSSSARRAATAVPSTHAAVIGGGGKHDAIPDYSIRVPSASYSDPPLYPSPASISTSGVGGTLTPQLNGSQDGSTHYSAAHVQALVDRVQQLEAKLSERQRQSSPASTTRSAITCSLGGADPIELPLKGSFSKSRYFGQSHCLHVFTSLPKVIELKSKLSNPENADVLQSLAECKRLARIAKSDNRIPVSPEFRDLVPPRNVADQLVQAYLRTFESVYRILHIPTFQREYMQFWNNPQSASTPFVIQLLLVMAIGTCFYRGSHEMPALRNSATQWIYATQAWMSSPFEKSRINLTAIQIHCLLLLARQTSAISADVVWVSAGSLLRTAMLVGLHRDPRHIPRMSIFQSELRRRLWATVLEITIISCADTGAAPLISLEDFDVEPPSNIDDVQMTDDDATIGLVAKPMEVFTQSSIQIMLTKSLPTRLKIIKQSNDLHPDPSYSETLQLAAEFSAINRSNSALLQSYISNRVHPTNLSFQRNLVDIMTHRFLLILHYPFSARATHDPTYYFSRKSCTDTALYLVSSSPPPQAPSGASTPNSQDDDFARLKLFGGGQFRTVYIHCMLIIAAELSRCLEEEASFPLLPSSTALSRREMHVAWENHMDLAVYRLRAEETNVKGYVFKCVIMAQIEAMEAGVNVEKPMIHAMRKSLEHSYQILKERVDANSAANVSMERGGEGPTEAEIQSGFEWDDLIQDMRLDLDIPDSWLFPAWTPGEED